MTEQDSNKVWKYLAIYMLAWFGFFGLILPLLDEYVLGFAYKNYMCENGWVLPINSTLEWCKIK